MNALLQSTQHIQAVWGLDKNTAETLVLMMGIYDLLGDDTAAIWKRIQKEFPLLLSWRKIRCQECGAVIDFFPNDGTIAVRDDGELICITHV